MAKIRVKAARVTAENLTMWHEDGKSTIIKQPDERIRPLLDIIMPIVIQGLIAEVELDPGAETNHYREFEKKSGGLVRMFRIAKSFVKHIFSDAPEDKEKVEVVEPVEVGEVPAEAAEIPMGKAEIKLTSAVDEIMANAKSVADEDYIAEDTKETDTIIAVVEGSDGKSVVIPGMENLKDQFARAIKLGSTIGVENFLKRISTVIEKRGHSINDLLRFMERNDLPIADDGTLVAYKALKTKGNHNGVFVDIHSGNVAQKVGSHVFMNEKMVDPDRRNDCSNGLHIARRAYVGGFRGDVITIVKVAPEDVIAVPQYDSNKMRVCGYHIVAEVPKNQHQLIYDNQPMTGGDNNDAAKMLGAVLAGKHVGILETVEIGGSRGSNLKITPVVKSEAAANKAIKDAAEEHQKAAPVRVLDDKEQITATDAKEIAEKTTAAKQEPNRGTTAAQARGLYNAGQIAQLVAFKKKAKKSYEALGFTAQEIALIMQGASTGSPVTNGQPAVQQPAKIDPKTIPSKMEEDFGSKTNQPLIDAAKEAEKLNEPVKVNETNAKEPPKMEGTRAEVARKLFDQAAGGAKQAWGHLWMHKKKAKKSWTDLGFSKKEEERIKTNKPDWV